MLNLKPVVFIYEDNYQIFVADGRESVMWVSVGEENFYDESDGILRSDVLVHKMVIPREKLDKVGKYTIYKRKIIERKPYFTQTEELESESFDFKVPKEHGIRAYHISDTHDNCQPPIDAAMAFGEIDLLILNGDINHSSESEEEFLYLYRIAGGITQGRIPAVFARGNHDTRGCYAEYMERYTPCENGRSYYSFRIGDLWGLVLNCGEDKVDDHAEYGNTMCCSAFRRRETEFLRKIVEKEESEYAAEGIKHKLVICHIPFTRRFSGEFDIETELYSEWIEILNEKIKPDLLLCGHKHKIDICEPGGENDGYGQKFPTVVGAEIENAYSKNRDQAYFIGCGLEFNNGEIDLTFTDSLGSIVKDKVTIRHGEVTVRD